MGWRAGKMQAQESSLLVKTNCVSKCCKGLNRDNAVVIRGPGACSSAQNFSAPATSLTASMTTEETAVYWLQHQPYTGEMQSFSNVAPEQTILGTVWVAITSVTIRFSVMQISRKRERERGNISYHEENKVQLMLTQLIFFKRCFLCSSLCFVGLVSQ